MSVFVDQTLRKARRHARKGEVELAAQQYVAILDKFPQNKQAIEGLRKLQPAATKTTVKEASFQASFDHLIALYNQGKLKQALVQGEALLEQFPDVPYSANLLGAVNAALGRPEQAVLCYTRALQIKPDFAEAYNNLGNSQKDLGESDAAIASYHQALRLKPDYAEAHNNLGATLGFFGRAEDALACYARALEIRPDYVEAHYNLGNAQKDLGKLEDAIASYHRALAIDRDDVAVYYNLGNAQKELGRLEAAVSSYHKVLQIQPGHAEALNNLGETWMGLQKPGEATASYRKALQIKPDFVEAHNNLGNALSAVGRREAALDSYTRALQINPGYTEAHRNLSNIKKYQPGDPQICQMIELIGKDGIADEDRIQLNFALARVHSDIGDMDKAFHCLSDANRLRKDKLRYQIKTTRTLFAKLKSTFSEDVPLLDTKAQLTGTKNHQPVFILGMPRSGTTLVEQILASHSRVYGAGELGLLVQAISELEWPSSPLTQNCLSRLRKSYLSGLLKFDVSARYITDKMPLNFNWIGLIFAAIPTAKIVHVKRDARATCWSIFKLYFPSKALGFAFDLEDVAGYYKLYVELMEFWHKRFPGQIYDLNYEALTQHQEDETRNLLAYIGLDWEASCLDFHQNQRAVQTASVTQVRQKMYQGSSEEWRKYEKHLGSMVESLKGF